MVPPNSDLTIFLFASLVQDSVKRRGDEQLTKEGFSISDIFFSKASAIGDLLVSLERELGEVSSFVLLTKLEIWLSRMFLVRARMYHSRSSCAGDKYLSIPAADLSAKRTKVTAVMVVSAIFDVRQCGCSAHLFV